VSHKLYPNVDFYSGIIYQAMGFPVEMFPVLFAIGRTPGWLAQWVEGILDPDQKISRPRQLYEGAALRHVIQEAPAAEGPEPLKGLAAATARRDAAGRAARARSRD